MQVVDADLQAWFLLKDGSQYYLSVRCQQSFAEYELLLPLSPDEYREYHALGRVYIDYLAARVSYWADEYKNRSLQNQYGAVVHRTIMD